MLSLHQLLTFFELLIYSGVRKENKLCSWCSICCIDSGRCSCGCMILTLIVFVIFVIKSKFIVEAIL